MAHRRQSCIPRSRLAKVHAHRRAHEAVISNRLWYGDGPPILGKAFAASKTVERQTLMIQILLRAAGRADKVKDVKLAETYHDLADKLYTCRSTARCGSMACPKCARAFQKAKVAALQTVIAELAKVRRQKHFVFVTIVPRDMAYAPGQFSCVNVAKANRWLKDKLKAAGFDRAMLGSADLGWESRRGGNYIQLHWHLALWTSNPKQLERKLKAIFHPSKKYERPVNVTKASDCGFLPYQNKAIKLPDLLRRNRKHLPELLLVLDRTEPLELLVLSKLRLGAQNGGLMLRVIKATKRRPANKSRNNKKPSNA